MSKVKSKYLKGKAMIPKPIPKNIGVSDLIDEYFHVFNAG